MSIFRTVLEKIKNINSLYKERGSILVLTALLLPIMFGCLGIAYDVGNIYIHKARLQNVTDAAALAGGRAYLQSQLKTGEFEHKDTYDSYTNGNDTDVEYVVGVNGGISTTREGNHPDADKAADKYIRNNIINLGEKVYSDKYSHYALPGLKKVGEDYVNDKKIFYRIGLYEKVPLHFLPVITNKKIEKVRAGSVVVLEPGTTTTTIIPGSGGDSSTVTHTSIFDNLFTFSESLFTQNNIDSNGNISQSFKGDMVYTHQNGTGDLDKSIFYDSSTPNPPNDGDAITNHQNHWYENKTHSSTEKINDPIIDTSFDTTAYLDAFKNKLSGNHIDVVQNKDKVVLRASDLNAGNTLEENNVFYIPLTYKINNDTHTHQNCDIVIDEPLKGIDENKPIYILVEGIDQVQIIGNADTTRRPVIVVLLSENTTKLKYEFKGKEFKGVIYAPISNFEHINNLTGTFRGNIITKRINIESSSKMTFIQENFLENSNYTDSDIKAISDVTKTKIEEANSKLTNEIKQRIADALTGVKVKVGESWWPIHEEIFDTVDVTVDKLGNMDWYNNLTYPVKQGLYTKWKKFYNDNKNDPNLKNILWPWNEHFDIKPGGNQTIIVTTPETLRLINYRTEFQMKDDLNNDDVVDPFIFETLRQSNSY